MLSYYIQSDFSIHIVSFYFHISTSKVSSSKQRLFSALQQIASHRNPLGQKETVETAR